MDRNTELMRTWKACYRNAMRYKDYKLAYPYLVKILVYMQGRIDALNDLCNTAKDERYYHLIDLLADALYREHWEEI